MKYDDASWHYGGDYPNDLPDESAFTHIGIFLAWAIAAGLAGDLHLDKWPEEIENLNNRKITGAEFLAKNCDGKFTDEDLSNIGNKFTSDFYDQEYYSIYVDLADPKDEYETVYHIPNTWEVFEKVSIGLNNAFSEWQKKNS